MSVPPPFPAAPPKRKRSVVKGCGIFAGVIVVLFVLSAVIAGIAGGGKSGTTKAEGKAPAPTASKASPKASRQPAAAPMSAKPKPATSSTGDPCPPTRDVIVWMRSPGIQDTAQVLGNYDQQNCVPTFQMLQKTSPTVAGSCTEAAWASDNPGYNADATPAPRLKKVQVAVGPAC